MTDGADRWQAAAHLAVLAVCLGALAAAALLAPTADGQGVSIGRLQLPEVCAMKRTTGLPCPGCGLSRSWVLLLDGDVAGSRALHPLGWLVLAYASLQALRHLAWLGAPAVRPPVEGAGRWLDRALLPLAALLLLVWLPRLWAAVSA